VVVGRGRLAGLAAGPDLARAGTDVVGLEARGRVGGPRRREWLPDGRPASTRAASVPGCARRAVAGGHGFYEESRWETLRVAQGSASVALRLGEELGPVT
jgi:cation diffusion facilitator CzcD-associated flavoprotein CzcO